METHILTRRFDPYYIINHICGHTIVKTVLEGSDWKNKRVVKWLETIKCPECKEKERQIA